MFSLTFQIYTTLPSGRPVRELQKQGLHSLSQITTPAKTDIINISEKGMHVSGFLLSLSDGQPHDSTTYCV